MWFEFYRQLNLVEYRKRCPVVWRSTMDSRINFWKKDLGKIKSRVLRYDEVADRFILPNQSYAVYLL